MTETTPAETPRRDPPGVLLAAWMILVAAFLLGVIRMRPPQESGHDAPAADFSATRATEALRGVLAGIDAHPVGSDANHTVRDRIVAQLREIGLAPEVERSFVVSPTRNRAAWVENVVARVAGTEPGPAVLLCAHYDSVPAGPGASDDGLGVATVLEAARALKASPPLRRDVVLLVTDGEELGLLGARAWVKAHGTDDVAAVVNVEARGTSGPSMMFEAGPGTAATVAAWARGAPRPVTSSLFAAVYRTMPNDTDLTVFREAGVPGLNFACVGGVQRYHTPLDDLAHADVRTLQQHGDNALAAVRGLAEAPGDLREAPEAVWFDVLGLGVVRWPESWSLPLGAAAFLFVAAAAFVGFRRGDLAATQILAGVGAAVVTLGGAVAAAWGMGALLGRLGALPTPFVADTRGPIAVAAGAATAVAGLVGVLAGRFATPRGLFSGGALVLAALGIGLGAGLPGGSYIAIVPALAAGVVACVTAARRSTSVAAPALTMLVAGAVIWLPLVPLLADALGVQALSFVALPFALAATVVVPFVGDGGPRRLVPAAAGLVVLAGGTATTLASAPYTADLPRPASVVWHRDEADKHAHWFVRPSALPVPEEMRGAADFEGETERVLPWDPARGWPAAAPMLPDVVAPSLADLQIRDLDGARRVTFRLVSRRGASCVSLAIEPKARVRRFVVGGVSEPPETLRRGGGPYVLDLWALPPEGIEFDLEIVGGEPVIAYVADATWGLPKDADALARARPGWCVPTHTGDETVVHRKVRL